MANAFISLFLIGMLVHYNKSRGIRMVISGMVLTVAHLFLVSQGRSEAWLLIPCILITVSGFLYLYRPYFELRTNELVVFNLMGAVVKQYSFSNLSDFELEESKIYIDKNGKRTRVRVSRLVANREEWERFRSLLAGQDLTHELHNI